MVAPPLTTSIQMPNHEDQKNDELALFDLYFQACIQGLCGQPSTLLGAKETVRHARNMAIYAMRERIDLAEIWTPDFFKPDFK